MKIPQALVFALWFYISVPIIGSGTAKDPYRADIPAALLKTPGIKVTAQIPSNVDGTPKHADAIVWIPDRIAVPKGVTPVADATAKSTILSRDGKADTTGMEQTK